MLRFRAILTSLLLLLIFGVNENVWAGANTNKKVQEKVDDQSTSESPEEEENETFTDWDFFGAFSLVNIQLQWRDHYSGVISEPTQTESSEGHQKTQFEAVSTDVCNGSDLAPINAVIPVRTSIVPLTSYRVVNEALPFSREHTLQFEHIIAYIQNCGTYVEC